MKARIIGIAATVVALAAIVPTASAATGAATTVVPNPRSFGTIVTPNPRIGWGTIVTPNPRIRFGRIVTPNPKIRLGVPRGVVVTNPRLSSKLPADTPELGR